MIFLKQYIDGLDHNLDIIKKQAMRLESDKFIKRKNDEFFYSPYEVRDHYTYSNVTDIISQGKYIVNHYEEMDTNLLIKALTDFRIVISDFYYKFSDVGLLKGRGLGQMSISQIMGETAEIIDYLLGIEKAGVSWDIINDKNCIEYDSYMENLQGQDKLLRELRVSNHNGFNCWIIKENELDPLRSEIIMRYKKYETCFKCFNINYRCNYKIIYKDSIFYQTFIENSKKVS